MKEITLNIYGKEIKATVSEEEIEKLTKKEWPQEGDPCWWLSSFGEIAVDYFCKYSNSDAERFLMGSMFQTEQEALDARRAQKLITAIAKRRKQLNGGWKPDWEDDYSKKVYLYWRKEETFTEGGMSAMSGYVANDASPFGVFENFESAKTIIEEFRDELKWYFTEYTVSVN